MLLTVGIATGAVLWRLHNDALERQFALAGLTARAMEDQLTQSLTVVEHTLTLAGSDPQARQRLAFYLQQAPYLRSVALADSTDRIRHSSNAANLGIALDRRMFMPQSTAPVAVLRSGSLFAGRDFADLRSAPRQPADNLSFIPLLLDVPQPDGSWHTVVAALNTDYFLNFYTSHLTALHGQIALLRYDGSLLIRSNPQPAATVYSPALRIRLAQSEAGSFTEQLADGRQLITAYRASRVYPFIIAVRLDRQQILANWRHEANFAVAMVGSILLLLIGMASVYYLRFEKLEARRQRDEEQLRIAAAAFESQEGIFVTDADNTILRVNSAFSTITGYSEAEAVGQTPHLLSSGKHPQAFYDEMWRQLQSCRFWSGEIWNRRKSGDIYPEWLTITAVSDAQNHISHYVATLTDITQRKRAEEEIRNLAYYDPLTRLPNRRLLLERLQQAVGSAGRRGNEGALLFIDLDNFKTLNDTLGHDMGDLLLQDVALRLNQCVREDDTVARLGGDEFVILLPNLSKNHDEAAKLAQRLGERIRLALNVPYDLAGHDYHATPSIGIAMFADGQHNGDELMKRADLALYSAKAAGRNAVHFFDPQMQKNLSERASLEAALRQAVAGDQLRLLYQPQIDHTGTIYGAEVLLRWQHPTLGLLSPDRFIALAEETGLIIPIGQWVLEQACLQLQQFSLQPAMAGLSLSVNISIRQLRQTDFTVQVQRILAASGAPPQRLVLELTESGLVDDIEASSRKMAPLRHSGVQFALDDFGTGYSSLAYLKKLPLDQLKVDQSFVRNVMHDQHDAAIVRTVIVLARALNLNVVAEGVETAEQLAFLQQQGCHNYQGYLFGQPMPLSELLALHMGATATPSSAPLSA
ncbi:bifunctional diguanylate cyclase/phosphodiesterase [Vogesella oryzae]|uniref:bifunctional diguanylate cyclase/phosphodiesterase n=1 Tax=Vogesella oryzae TaxID=1735285 RepID=UPI00158219FC|nr:EAL domain-containing protein [Vogesella oryzae]